MAAPVVFPQDVVVQGRLSVGLLTLPNSSITNEKVAADAGITASKLQHQNVVAVHQAGNVPSVNQSGMLYMGYAQGSILSMRAGALSNFTGNAAVTIDIRKNGVTVLSSNMTIDIGTDAFDYTVGTLSVTAYNPGDVFTFHITVNAGNGTLGNGTFIQMITRENAQ